VKYLKYARFILSLVLTPVVIAAALTLLLCTYVCYGRDAAERVLESL